MKILITGASGNLGKLTRLIFIDHEVHLCSRKNICTNRNELWLQAQSLDNNGWWSNFKYITFYDIIFHFAEPVKEKILKDKIDLVKKSHLKFLTNSIKNSHLIIYPSTAYKYDKNISSPYSEYLEIKEDVIANLPLDNNIKCPIFHPLIDYGDGLTNLIKLSKYIPFFNIFFSFRETLPVLYKSDLEWYILSVINADEKCPDIYSKIMSISSIFNVDTKVNSALISKIVLLFMRILNHPKLYLLLNGRKIRA